MNIRYTLANIGVCGLVVVGMASAASAAECPDGFPNKPVEIWNGYSPGGLSDILSRAIAAEMEKQQDWKVVVLNKPGAGTSLMWTQISRAPADGYAFGVSAGPSAITRAPYKNPDNPYQPEDFTYLGTAQTLDETQPALDD